MRSPGMLVMSLALAAVACAKPFPCTRYCWSHKQTVSDFTNPDTPGVPEGRFDMHCDQFSSSQPWYPPLPPFGWYPAEQCLPADTHQIIAKVVATIQDPTLDASQACDVTDLQVYADFVQSLAMQARDACIAHLTCNGAPAGCDLDPTDDGPQACQLASAETLCDQVVLAPALAALSDLSNGPGAAQPQRDGTAIEYMDDPNDCQPLAQDTDSTPPCDDPADGNALDGSSTSGSGGLDDTTGGGLGPRPPGDVEGLVTPGRSITRSP